MHISGRRIGVALSVLLSLVVVVSIELVKFTGPQVDFLMNTRGLIVAALLALVTYASPAIWIFLFTGRRGVGGTNLVWAVMALAVARVAVQVSSGSLRLILGFVAVSIGLATITLVAAATSRFGGVLVARGFAGGVFLSAALSLSFGTLDVIWRPGFVAGAVTGAIVALAVALAARMRSLPEQPYAQGLWALGPALSLAIMVFANPAFTSSQAGIPLWAATVSLLAAFLLATVLLRSQGQPTLLLTLVVVLATATVYFVPGWPQPGAALVSIIVVVFVALLGGGVCGLVAVATERSQRLSSRRRLAGAASGTGLLVILPTLVFQVDYDIPLGFPNAFVIVTAAALLCVYALYVERWERRLGHRASQPDPSANSRSGQLAQMGALVGVAVLTVIGAFIVRPTVPDEIPEIAVSQARVLNWNLHYGVSLDGDLTWDEMAEVISDSGAHIVALQEVSRGWILGGGGDMLTYLANELGMEYAFVGAADLQFGNALLWNPMTPLTDIERTALAYGDGPQHRSAIAGTWVSSGIDIRFVSAHLQHRESNTPTRMLQIADLFEGLDIDSSAVVMGDFNAEPGWPEIIHFESQGFESAVDVYGDPNAMTYPATDPTYRIDWTFTLGVTTGETTVLDTEASDHLPILSSVSVPAPNLN
ncbi:endonuclease/exonuclease/phosphatase family protein [Populibacterium corticicola]|uniref:Endonuclease/exonuclease/phosphatase family protein n=1 Tax=Populibacterium corticicola TaxID=1812826 RepID=A0ABW5XGD9_9MICO